MRRRQTFDHRESYVLRVMAMLALTLSLLVALVKLWPPPEADGDRRAIYRTTGQETIEVEEVVPTLQAYKAPPPPAPLPPVVVPDDVIVEDVELEFTDSYLPIEEPGLDREQEMGDTEGTPAQMAVVETAPKLVRFVEPEYTREARRKKVRAEVVVEVLVDERGRVQDSRIVERYLLGDDEDDPKQPVEALGYGLEEAALSAAQRSLFRPARHNGTPVSSYTTLTFSFGV